MATDSEIIALADAFAASSREVRQAKNRLQNAMDNKTEAEQRVVQRTGEMAQAETLMRQARHELDVAIDTRAV